MNWRRFILFSSGGRVVIGEPVFPVAVGPAILNCIRRGGRSPVAPARQLVGNAGDDVLVAGYTAHDATAAALKAFAAA